MIFDRFSVDFRVGGYPHHQSRPTIHRPKRLKPLDTMPIIIRWGGSGSRGGGHVGLAGTANSGHDHTPCGGASEANSGQHDPTEAMIVTGLALAQPVSRSPSVLGQ